MNFPKEPCKQTCPEINHTMSTIKYIVDEIKYCTTIEDFNNQKDWWINQLDNIGIGRYCELENLRTSNSQLRDWGSELYSLCENLELEKDELEIELNNIR